MAKKRKPIPHTDPKQYPCPLCGSEDYEFGSTYQTVGKYISKDASIVKEISAIFKPKRTVKCRVCLNCGYLMFLVDER